MAVRQSVRQVQRLRASGASKFSRANALVPDQFADAATTVGCQHAGASRAEARVGSREVRRIEKHARLALSQVGEELYEIFIRGYTHKQWGRDPSELPASIVRRIPIRTTLDDRYFDDRFQGIPIGGYTRLFENMLDHELIDIELNTDYFAHSHELRQLAGKTVYTGKLDEFFDYRFGELEYRSLRFESEIVAADFQDIAIVNHTDRDTLYTRVTEHKHFESKPSKLSVITREYPLPSAPGHVPYYPVRDAANTALCQRYLAEAQTSGVLFGGRLASYQYFDMHQVIASAMTLARKEFGFLSAAPREESPRIRRAA